MPEKIEDVRLLLSNLCKEDAILKNFKLTFDGTIILIFHRNGDPNDWFILKIEPSEPEYSTIEISTIDRNEMNL